jgi:acetyltransferase-like isoleucine patch superfamily enzyme
MRLFQKVVRKLRILGFSKAFHLIVQVLEYKWKMKYGYFIHSTAKLENRKLVKIGKFSEIQEYVIIRTFKSHVNIGKYSQINPYTVVYGESEIEIGDNVMIAPHCMIASGNHDYRQLDKPMRHGGELSKGKIVIEDGVWIGANSTITDGVNIGHDAVISANSVVISNVKPFDVVGGVPAKFISNRIDTYLNRNLTDEERQFYVNKFKAEYDVFMKNL